MVKWTVQYTGGSVYSDPPLVTYSDVAFYPGTIITYWLSFSVWFTVRFGYGSSYTTVYEELRPGGSGSFTLTQSVIDAATTALGHYPDSCLCYPNLGGWGEALHAHAGTGPLPFSRVTLTITDVYSSEPIVGAAIGGTVGSGVTDSNGIWVSNYLANGSAYSYYATATYYQDSASYWTPALSGAYATTLDMYPSETDPPIDPDLSEPGPFDPATMAYITVHVTDVNTHANLSGATVHVWNKTLTADSNGRISTVVWKHYRYTYYASKTGYVTSATVTTATILTNVFYAVPLTPTGTSAPVCDFSGSPLTGRTPLSVGFLDLSTNTPTSWSWDFGDGTALGTTRNPIHVYTVAGTYTVSLTVTNAYGSDDKTRSSYISVSQSVVTVVGDQVDAFPTIGKSAGIPFVTSSPGDIVCVSPNNIAVPITTAAPGDKIIVRYTLGQTIGIKAAIPVTFWFLLKWSITSQPWGVATDSSGNAFVVNTGAHCIQKFDSIGAFVSQFGEYGSGDGQFSYPVAIAIDGSDNIYVSEWGNQRIQKFNSSGVYQLQWGTFENPYGIATDSSGFVYISDMYSSLILKYTALGVYVSSWGSYGSGDGEFNLAWGITIDGSDNVYVADWGNARVQKFTNTGTFISKFDTSESPTGISTDSDGNVFVTRESTHNIQMYNSLGTLITQWGTYGTEDGNFYTPRGIGISSDNKVYIADMNNNRIQKFSRL